MKMDYIFRGKGFLLCEGDVKDRIVFLSKIYNYAKDYPALVQIKEVPKIKDKVYRVVFDTRGQICQFKNEDEVREMAKSVLTGLTWLHKEVMSIVTFDFQTFSLFLVPEIINTFLLILNIVVLVD